ncbi:MAG: AMP-dependent synthetase [Verrucomicrobia bacterium]|nr:MAG: AMP-dependent synthetase [Verrucomicrobiota bacterium]
MRRLLRFLLRLAYRYRAYGVEALQTPGPVLLIPNHVSWLDWLFLYVLLDLDWKFVVSRQAAGYSFLHRWIMINRRTFPIDNHSPYAVKRLAEFLEGGGRLVLFAEGQISRTGSLMKVYEGAGLLLHKTRARVILCYLRGANRLRWSRQPGWRRWWPRITAHFAPPQSPPETPAHRAAEARERLTVWLQRAMMEQQFQVEQALGPDHVVDAVVEAARPVASRTALQDVTMQEVSYRRLLVGADLLGRRLAERLDPQARRVGVLLPNVNAAPITLLALWSRGRVPAILNYTTGPEIMQRCCEVAGLRQVVTSRAFLERAKLEVEPLTRAGIELIYLEDVRAGIRTPERLWGLIRHTLRPRTLSRIRRRHAPAAGRDTAAVVLFTSGSEGLPKGVELSHGNLLANLRQMLSVIAVLDSDRVFNALPLFHSFGLTVGTVLGLVRGLYVFLYPSPLHYRMIPSVVYDRQATILLSTNTFLHGYARSAHPYDFHTVRLIFSGAEKLQPETARLWADKFGVRVFEGYGVTECSPVVSANTPLAPRPGSTGQLLPGMEWRLEPVDGVREGGRLHLRGPNVMKGYLNPEANARFQAAGCWHDTGDIARVDEDGFLYILGRVKRFAKIGGEMVSLTAVEEALWGAFPELGGKLELAVVSRRDAEKGETLVLVTNDSRLTLEAARDVIRRRGLSNLYVPRERVVIGEIPKLGTGKVNHRALSELVEAGAQAGAG